MQKLILLRHGESVWNKEDRFTGWTDVDLSETGYIQAMNAGALLKKHNYTVDVAFTSLLKRAIKTLHIVLEQLDCLWVPEQKSWRLNERFYGALQGLNKSETAVQYGAEQVQKWRRNPIEHPPAITKTDPRYPGHDIRYKNINDHALPLTENLSETITRVLPFWNEAIIPALQAKQKVIITAHGNSLRALIKYIGKLSDQEVTALEIPTGAPLICELDDKLTRIKQYYLA